MGDPAKLMKKLITYFVIALASAGLGLGLVRWWVIAHLDLSRAVYIQKEPASTIANLVDDLDGKIKSGELPSIKEDFASVGSRTQEARLLELRRFVQSFEVGYGRPPRDSSELGRLATEGELSLQQRRLVQKDARDCQVFPMPGDSYLLNCDEWHPTQSESLSQFVARLDKETERFYVIGGHVFVYSPPFVGR
ncbi:MAG: hypothetical protein WA755_09790 [Candidatus Acidiferrales bacterium]